MISNYIHRVVVFFKAIPKWKWWLWIGVLPVVIISVVMILSGHGLLHSLFLPAGLGTMGLGVIGGSYVARFATTKLLTVSKDFGKRLEAGLGGFGCFFLVALTVNWANANLDIEIDTQGQSLEFQIWWAVLVGVTFFCVSPKHNDR